jgi:hypothetical protein
MAPQKDMMEYRNLDRVCLNLLAYQRIQIGPPGTLTVDQITNCFADIPKTHVHKALAALDEKGFIHLGPGGKNAFLTSRGFDHIRRFVSEPICTNVFTDSPIKAR